MQVQVKPYSQKELQLLYDVSQKTFASWLAPFRKKIGDMRGRIYTVKQVEIIFLVLGIPHMLEDESS